MRITHVGFSGMTVQSLPDVPEHRSFVKSIEHDDGIIALGLFEKTMPYAIVKTDLSFNPIGFLQLCKLMRALYGEIRKTFVWCYILNKLAKYFLSLCDTCTVRESDCIITTLCLSAGMITTYAVRSIEKSPLNVRNVGMVLLSPMMYSGSRIAPPGLGVASRSDQPRQPS